ncbi:MAG: hypothetical protein DI587_13865 [Variovorax paradoxus]|nr:MAG: hypothetical protein DI583_13865 [Variovorax paradoxus]PZQ09837.1 MAG: hypothetical protein DI587_13865 [Variovorax paradoxus]
MGYGILRAAFLYRSELGQHSYTRHLAVPGAAASEAATAVGGGAALAVELAVGLVGKAAESLIDAAAAYVEPDAAVLDVTIPLDGFYEGAGPAAVDGGCLVFHDTRDPRKAMLGGALQLRLSGDGSAFRFHVVKWTYEGFLQPDGRLLQRQGDRDVAFKVEFLTPGIEGLGNRTAFMERLFTNVDADERATLLQEGEALPWIAAPRRPAVLTGEIPAGERSVPLNVRVTVIETPKPNQLGAMLLSLAKDKRTQIVDWAKESAKAALGPAAAAHDPKLADEAGAAYTAYATAWDAWHAIHEARPQPPTAADPAAQAEHDKNLKQWTAQREVKLRLQDSRRLLARAAFETAGLPWPGDLAIS